MSSVFSPEDHHVDEVWFLHRRGHAGEPANRTQANVEIHDLPDRDIEAAEATTDRRGERTLDADQVLLELVDRVLRQPVAGLVEGFLAGEDFHPLDRLAVLRGGSIEDELCGRPDVDTRTVAFDERNDRVVRHVKRAVFLHRDLLSHTSDGSWPRPIRA